MVLEEVKEKKEYSGLNDNFVRRVMKPYELKYNVYEPKQRKKFVKEVRAKLRELYGAFLLPTNKKRNDALNKIKSWDDKEGCERVLKMHISTKERYRYYEKIYSWLKSKTPVYTVFDIGCGYNIFSMPWLGNVHYYGLEINKDDVDFCNAYLNKFQLTGAIRYGDVFDFEKFMKVDVVFLFKVLEGFEALERGFTEKLLKKLDCDYILVSFATRSLGGGKVISEKRLKWFLELVDVVERKKFGDEVYFLCRKKGATEGFGFKGFV